MSLKNFITYVKKHPNQSYMFLSQHHGLYNCINHYQKVTGDDVNNEAYQKLSELIPLFNDVLSKKSKILKMDLYGNLQLNSSGEKLIRSTYKEVKKELYKSIHLSKNLDLDLDEVIINAVLNHSSYKFVDENERKIFVEEAKDFYNKTFKQKIFDSYDEKDDKESHLAVRKIGDWIVKNLQRIFLTMDVEKDFNNVYEASWIDSNGELSGGGLIEKEYLLKFLRDNFDVISEEFKVKTKDKYGLILNVIDYCEAHYDVLKKLHDLIQAKNLSLKKQRAKEILTLQDKVGDETTIDYDVSSDHVRNRPIIVVNDVNTNKDYVFFGPPGTSHGNFIQVKLPVELKEKGIKANDYKLGYGYLLGSIAFVDEGLSSYSLEELTNILKNDSRINKVYRVNSNDSITRLAKLVN